MGKEKNDKGVLTMESDLKQFAKIMSVLGELYSKPLSEILIEIYWRVLKNYSLQEIKAVVYSYINHENEGSFMPKPADIIRHIHQQEKQKALDAWSKVENAIRQVGRYNSISFDDQLIHFVIKKMGGWIKLCSYTTYQMPTIAHDFIKEYTDCLQNLPDDIPQFIKGVFDQGDIVKIDQINSVDMAQSQIRSF